MAAAAETRRRGKAARVPREGEAQHIKARAGEQLARPTLSSPSLLAHAGGEKVKGGRRSGRLPGGVPLSGRGKSQARGAGGAVSTRAGRPARPRWAGLALEPEVNKRKKAPCISGKCNRDE